MNKNDAPRESINNSLKSQGEIRSRQRVADHGEVFTPAWLVEEMLDHVKDESERIDSRFLEPACGSGNFLVPVLQRKLGSVQKRYRRNEFERNHYALLALMSIYGIELLEDNLAECRINLLETFSEYLKIDSDSIWYQAGFNVVTLNIVQGDALATRDSLGAPIIFAEWSYLGMGLYSRRDFRYDNLLGRAALQGSMWDGLDDSELFAPIKVHPTVTVEDIGK